jgi:hypothetical protein
MHIENKTGKVQLTKTIISGGMWSAQWKKVPVSGPYVRFQNRWTGDYMHIEHKRSYVELTKTIIPGGMWSAQWELVPAAAPYPIGSIR